MSELFAMYMDYRTESANFVLKGYITLPLANAKTKLLNEDVGIGRAKAVSCDVNCGNLETTVCYSITTTEHSPCD